MTTIPIDGLRGIIARNASGSVNRTEDTKAGTTGKGPETLPGLPLEPDRVEVSSQAAKNAQAFQSQGTDGNGEAPSASDLASQRIRQAIDDLKQNATAAGYAIEELNGRVLLRVINRASGETVRQIPPEEVLRLQERLKDVRGILFDQVS